jgi:hypothetical protein
MDAEMMQSRGSSAAENDLEIVLVDDIEKSEIARNGATRNIPR